MAQVGGMDVPLSSRRFAAVASFAGICVLLAASWGRAAPAAVGVLAVAAAAAIAWAGRRDAVLAGRGGAGAMAAWALGPAIGWAALIALRDPLRLGPPSSTAALGLAALGGGLLLAAAVRAVDRRPIGADTLSRATAVAAGLAWLALLWGALTVETGAGSACAGFPLCNGHVLPPLRLGADAVQIHWTHRLLSYVLTFLVLAASAAALRSPRRSRTPLPAAAALVLVLAQVWIGARLASQRAVPAALEAHRALGLALCGVLVVWALRARRTAPPVRHHPARRAGRRTQRPEPKS